MKLKFALVTSLAAAFAVAFAGLALLAAFPGDLVISRYSTLAAARTDQVFERGWLPDILPPSTYKIETANNLDLNTSEGQFSLSVGEWPGLKEKLKVGVQPAPFDNWPGTVGKKQAAGFSAWHYEESNTTWVFFCKAEVAYCEYMMWIPI